MVLVFLTDDGFVGIVRVPNRSGCIGIMLSLLVEVGIAELIISFSKDSEISLSSSESPDVLRTLDYLLLEMIL